MIILLSLIAFVALFLGIFIPSDTATVQPKVIPMPEVGKWFHAPRGAALASLPIGGYQATGRGSDMTRYHPARVVAVSGGKVLLRVSCGHDTFFYDKLVTVDAPTFWKLFKPDVYIQA